MMFSRQFQKEPTRCYENITAKHLQQNMDISELIQG